MQLVLGNISESADYVTRSIPAGANTKVTITYDAIIPGTADVKVYVQKIGEEWQLVDLTAGKSVGDNWVHVAPRILIAPGFTHQLPETESDTEKSKNPVISALIPIAEKLRAIIVVDSPNTNDEEAIKYRKSIASSRVYVVDPWVKVFTDKEEILPSSPFVAGLIAKVDNEHGFWWSPSNQEINGIVGTSRAIDFTLGDANCRANYLNENEVATIIHQQGYRLWGVF